MRTLVIVAVACLVVQTVSATFFVRDFESPNASTLMARNLVANRSIGVRVWHRLRGPTPIDAGVLRAWHLPGEACYLSVVFRTLPPSLARYAHVPITVLLVTSIAAVGLMLGGPKVAAIAGAIMTFDPFVVLHGPVWDDTFLAAALVWLILALVLAMQARPPRSWLVRGVMLLILAVLAEAAAFTRADAQLVLPALGAWLVVGRFVPRVSSPEAKNGWSLAMGMMLVVGVALVMLSWGMRNYQELGEWSFGTSHDGVTLYESNYDRAREALLETGTVEGFSQTAFGPHFAAVASQDMSELQADRYFREQAWASMRARPLDTAVTSLLKIFTSLTGIDWTLSWTSPRNLAAIVPNTLLWLAFAGGVVVWRRQDGLPGTGTFVVFATILLGTTLLVLALGPTGLRYWIAFAGVRAIVVAGALAVLTSRSSTKAALLA